jgi:Tfp pilus assembly protein PilO
MATTLRQRISWCARVQWTVLAALGLGVVLFYVLAARPGRGRLESLRQQIQTKQRELKDNQYRARDLPMLAFEVQQLESQVEIYNRQFPKQPDLGQFIKDITQVSQQLALADWKYQPNAPKRTGTYFEMPIGMQFRGDFLNVASFLRQIETLPRLTRVKRIHIHNRDWKSGMVDVEMSLNIYFSEG